MTGFGGVRRLLRLRVRRQDVDREIDDEIATHLAMRVDWLVARGMAREDAEREASRRFGDLEQARRRLHASAAVREERMRLREWLENLARDVRWSMRSLAKAPSIAAAVIFTLALGVGATTVMFSIVNGILLDPLPFGNSDRLVWTVNRGTRPYDAISPLDMGDWARLVPSFEAVGSWAPSNATLDDGLAPVHIGVAEVTDNWFTMLGVRPQLGRGFVPGEQGQRPTVVVLSDGLWRTSFGADPHIVGRTVHIDGSPYTVVGIAPPGFDFPEQDPVHVDVWRPVAMVSGAWANRAARFFRGPVALLRRGASFAQAQREARVAAAQMRAQDPVADAGLAFDIEPLHDHLVGNTRRPLVILLAAVGALLLIACVNVATLLLVRANSQSAEMGIRLALGASRGRITSQLLLESLLLAAAGGVLGTLAAVAGVHAIVSLNIGNLPLLANVQLDGRVLAFSLTVTSIAGLGFGLAPALRSARTDVVTSLRPGARSSADRSTARLREGLVAVEVALVVPLLIGALLLATSFSRLLATNPGFRADQLIHFDVSLPQCGTEWLPDSTCATASGTHYTHPDDIRRFTHELLDRLRALPGAQVVSAGFGAPFTSSAKNQGGLPIVGVTPPTQVNSVEVKYIAPGYFAALGTPFVQGRDFDRSDHPVREYCSTTAIVSDGAVRAYFGGLPPLSTRITGYCDSTTQIIGVVKDVKTQSLAAAPEPALYLSLDDAPVNFFTVLVRTTSEPGPVMSAARQEVAALDRSVPIYNMETMRETLERSAAPAHLAARVVAGFAAAALAIAVIGMIGLVEYVVRERRRELGIRMALGAQPGQVVMLMLRTGIVAVVCGLVPGVLIALAASRVMNALLYGVGSTDAATYALACVLMSGVAIVACWLPARRAAHIDPTSAIRAD